MPHRAKIKPTFLQSNANALAQRIRDAFGDIPQIGADEVFAPHFERMTHEHKEPLREIFVHTPWYDFSDTFLKGYWNYVSYLAPSGYRALVAALMRRSLQPLNRDNVHAHATLYTVLRYANSPDNAPRNALFTPEQKDLTREFLGLYMNLEHGYPWLCATAMRRWHTDDTSSQHPAVRKVQAFERKHRHFTYPELTLDHLEFDADDPEDIREWQERQRLAQRVRDSFADTPYPSTTPLAIGYDEAAEYDEEFRGTHWQTLSPDFLSQYYAAPSFFTPEAFRFFLPGYMLADIYDYPSNVDLTFHLTYQFDEEKGCFSEYVMETMGLFNAREREAIHAFLRFHQCSRQILAWWSRTSQ